MKKVEYGRDGRPLERPFSEKLGEVVAATAALLFLVVVLIILFEGIL